MTPADRNAEPHGYAARAAVRTAAHTIALTAGSSIITRPICPGAETTAQDVEPLAGASAVREIELAPRQAARRYIRDAREAGYTWHQIGQALGLKSGSARRQIGETIAEAAYDYTAGPADTETARRYGRTFVWTCTTCGKTVSDRGLCNGPADDEHGHAEHCTRLAATFAGRTGGRPVIEVIGHSPRR